MAHALPTWEGMGPARRVWEAAGPAIIWGLLCGLANNVSEPLYLAGTLIGILGGVAGGAQHLDVRAAVLRGLVAGTFFGLAILAGFHLGGGEDPKADLPDPEIALLLLTVIPAGPLHALGAALRRRRERRLAT